MEDKDEKTSLLTQLEPEGKKNRFSFLAWLFCLTSSLCGVQFVYTIQFAVGTPLFTDELKLSSSMVSLIQATAGPVSGFVVQPVVGVISDRCSSKLGRRRPFILGGGLVCALGMALLGNSKTIGDYFGDDPDGIHPSDHTISLVLAIAGLWITNVCVNIVQGPARAIVADLVSQDEQQTGNAMVSNVMGLAAIIGNVVGAQFLSQKDPYRILFLMGIGLIILSIIPTMIAAKEKQYEKPPGQKTSVLSVFGQIWKGFRHMPAPLIRIVIVLFFSWAAFSPFMIYITQYFGNNVYGANSNTDNARYRDGVKMGMYGLGIFAGVQLLFSLVMPDIVRIFKVKPTYFISQILAAACYILLLWFDRPVSLALALTSLVAINFTCFNSIPFGLVTSSSNKEDAGLYMGVLNSASVVAQTVTELIAGQIVNWKDQNVAWGIAFGGIVAVLGSFLIWTLPTTRDQTQETPQP